MSLYLAELVAQAAASGADTSVFIQYGALGLIAMLALGAVRVLFQREVKALDLERQRADRLEEELRTLNRTVQERYVTTLTDATRTMGELLDRMNRGTGDESTAGRNRRADR